MVKPRIALLASSIHSERAIATLAQIAATEDIVGVVALRTLSLKTLLRKFDQLGSSSVISIARKKIGLSTSGEDTWQNPYHHRRLSLLGLGDLTRLDSVAAHYGVPLVKVKTINGPDSLNALRAWSPHLILYTGGGILRKPLLDIPGIGVLNAHAGELPRYRGASVVDWALLHGDVPAVSLHFIDTGIDTGRVLEIRPVPLRLGESLPEYRWRAEDATVTLLAEGANRPLPSMGALANGSVQSRQFYFIHDSFMPHVEAAFNQLQQQSSKAGGG